MSLELAAEKNVRTKSFLRIQQNSRGSVNHEKKSTIVSDFIVQWFGVNPEDVKELGNPGPRMYDAVQKKMYLKENSVFRGFDDGMRGPAALVHGLDSVRGRAVALRHLHKLLSLRP